MKARALAVFRQPPERLNCAQSVAYAWRSAQGESTPSVADFKPFGGGRAPGGLCGALHAACALAPDKAESMKREFATRLGSLQCQELRAAQVHACEACVAQAAELLAQAAPGHAS